MQVHQKIAADKKKVKQVPKKVFVRRNTGPPVARKPIPKPKPIFKESIPLDITATNATSILKLDVPLDNVAFQLPFIAFYAHLTSNSSVIQFVNTSTQTNPYSFIASGVVYLYDELAKYLTSGSPTPTRLPLVFLDLIAALLPKNVRTRSGSKIGYSFSQITPLTLPTVSVAGRNWTFQEPLLDNGAYNVSSVAVAPLANADAYIQILQLLDSLNFPQLRVVDNVVAKSKLANSVSAYARAYIYNGLYPSGAVGASGYYKDIELEVPIFNPMYAHFAPYGNDSRVPRYLSIGSGDACGTYGISMRPKWGGYHNSGHPIFKFIDFENVFDVLTLWACKVKEALASNTDAGYNSNLYTAPFEFSSQDFRIVLRQALLGFFNENYWTQFTGPLINEGTNWFAPFMVTGNTFPKSNFLQMQIPQLLQENLAALKYRVVGIKKNMMVVVPVVGRYVADTPITPQFDLIQAPDGGAPVTILTSLFAPDQPTGINLIDGSTSGGYANLNGQYYTGVLNSWNQFVSAAQRVSTQTVTFTADSGAIGLHALTMTRSVSAIDGQGKRKLVNEDTLEIDERFVRRDSKGKLNVQSVSIQTFKPDVNKYIANMPNAKKNVSGIPPASAASLQSLAITSVSNFAQTEYGLIQQLILPTIRFDATSTQILTTAKYQTETLELVSVQMQAEGSTVSSLNGNSNELMVWENYATMMIKGAGGEASQYAEIMKVLASQGHAGILSNILGGLAKTILPPEMHGIVDGVSAVIPF